MAVQAGTMRDGRVGATLKSTVKLVEEILGQARGFDSHR